MTTTRRRFLRAASSVAAATGWATLLARPASAATAATTSPATAPKPSAANSTLTGRKSANGWPVNTAANAGGSVWNQPVPGTDFGVEVNAGDVAAVLVHVIRRFHYEIGALSSGDVTGFITPGQAQAYESNHTSGTAVAIRPGWYPRGARGGFFPLQLAVVRDILAECEGVVRWGGDDSTPYEAQFSIDVPPGDARLTRVAAKIRGWVNQPGAGAGCVADTRSVQQLVINEAALPKQRATR